MQNLKTLLIFPIISAILLTVIVVDNYHILKNEDNIINTYLQSVKDRNYGYGDVVTFNNGTSFEQLIPGDIVLGGWDNCAYGRFSHAGLYLGDNEVLEAYIDKGVFVRSIDHYKSYTEIALLRVNVDQTIRDQAIEYALTKQNALFSPIAFNTGEKIYNCTKIIYQSYLKQGINLDSKNNIFIAPDSFFESPLVSILVDKGKNI